MPIRARLLAQLAPPRSPASFGPGATTTAAAAPGRPADLVRARKSSAAHERSPPGLPRQGPRRPARPAPRQGPAQRPRLPARARAQSTRFIVAAGTRLAKATAPRVRIQLEHHWLVKSLTPDVAAPQRLLADRHRQLLLRAATVKGTRAPGFDECSATSSTRPSPQRAGDDALHRTAWINTIKPSRPRHLVLARPFDPAENRITSPLAHLSSL